MSTTSEVFGLTSVERKKSTHNIVIRGIQSFQETSGSPPTSKDNESLLFWVKGKLCTRIAIELSDVVERPSANKKRDKGCTAEELEEVTPS